MSNKEYKKYIIFLVLAGALLRGSILTRNLDIIDRIFIPDDTYYTLSIARSMAEGKGPSADGYQLTNGFQPLLGFILVPLFTLIKNPDCQLRVDLIFTCLFSIINIFLISLIVKLYSDSLRALLAGLIWAISPISISNALCGLETSLSLLFILTIIILWTKIKTDQEKSIQYIFLGVAIGLAVLARIDTVLLILSLIHI